MIQVSRIVSSDYLTLHIIAIYIYVQIYKYINKTILGQMDCSVVKRKEGSS